MALKTPKSARAAASRRKEPSIWAPITRAIRSSWRSATTAAASTCKRSRTRAVERGLLNREESGRLSEADSAGPDIPAGIQHCRRDHRNLRARRRSGCGAKHSASPEGHGAGGNPSRPGHHVPAVAASHAGHHQSASVPGGTAPVCHSPERRGRDRAGARIRPAPGG